MPHLVRAGLTLTVVLLAVTGELHAQTPLAGDPPTPLVPLKPQTREELDRREARKLYGLSMLHQREDRILEAVRTLEDAIKLDPASAAIHKALVPLYLALSRSDDALNACKKTVANDPGDYQTWFVYSRQLRDLERLTDALDALKRAVACPAIKDRPDQLVQMQFDLGTLLEEVKDYAQAEAAYREVVKILEKPETILDLGPYNREQIQAESAKTYERIGRVCIQQKRHDRAEVAFRKAQEKDRDHAGRLNYNLAEVCLAQNKPGDALRYLDQYLKTQPPGTEGYELRITLLNRLQRANEVLPSLQQFADRDEHNVALHLLLARQYTAARQWDEAERLYQKLLAEGPTPEVYLGLFRLYKEEGKLTQILSLFDEALATANKNKGPADGGTAAAAVKARSMLLVLRDDADLVKALLPMVITELNDRKERTRESRRFFAVLAARTHQLDAAERLYRSCLEDVTAQNEAEVYLGLLDILWEARKLKEVDKLCKEGLEKAQATNRLNFHVNRARALVQLGQAEEAITEADKAVDMADESNRLRIRRLRVDILIQADRFDKAEAECKALLKDFTQPGEVRDIRYSLSSVYSFAKDYAKSEEQLRIILEADPNDATANNDLGYIMADQGKNLEEAEKLIRKAVELDLTAKKNGAKVRTDDDPNNANAAYLDSLGWVLFRRGQFPAARDWLEKAVNLPGGTEDPTVWDHLGDVYFRMKDTTRAGTAWKKAHDLYEQEKRRKVDEHYKELKNKLKLLEQETQQR